MAEITIKQLSFSEREIEMPEYLDCPTHGAYSWQCFYEEREIVEMLDEQGFIDCPYCMAEIVGIE